MRNGPYFPDVRTGRKAVVHYPNGRNEPGEPVSKPGRSDRWLRGAS